MKKIFKTLSLMMLALVASTAVAQSYSGIVTEYGANYKPVTNYTITYNDDKTLTVEITLSEGCVGLVPQVCIAGSFMNLNLVSDLHYSVKTGATYEMGTELSIYFYHAYSGGASASAAFVYVVGSTNSSAEDTEAPTAFELLSCTPSAVGVEFIVRATDNSGVVAYVATIQGVETRVLGTSESNTVIQVKGLEAETTYEYAITVADNSGNVCETVLNGSFTTTEAKTAVYYGNITVADYVQGADIYAPTISYTITYNTDQTLSMDYTLSESYVGLVPEVNFANDNYLASTSVGDLHYQVFSTATYDAGTVLDGFFWLKYVGGVSRANFSYTVGAENAPAAPDPSDTEAPVINSAVVSEPTHESATLIVNITDNVTETVTVEVSADNFTSVMTTWYGIDCGSDVALTIEGLEPETTYNLAVRATDASENVSDVKAIDEFVTGSAPVYTAATFNGYMVKNEDWSVVNTPADADAPFAPHLYYSIITNVDNTLTFNLELTEKLVGLVGQIWINNGLIVTQPIGEYTLNFTTTQAYEREQVLKVYFRFEYPTNVSATKEFDFVVGSSQNLPNAIEGVVTAKADVYAANGAIYIGSAYAGQKVEVYNIDGRLVYSANAKEKIELIHNGIYIVKVCGVAYKVVL